MATAIGKSQFCYLDEVVSNGSAINDEVSFNELQGLLPVFTEHLQKLRRSFENCFPERINILHGYVSHFLMILQQQI